MRIVANSSGMSPPKPAATTEMAVSLSKTEHEKVQSYPQRNDDRIGDSPPLDEFPSAVAPLEQTSSCVSLSSFLSIVNALQNYTSQRLFCKNKNSLRNLSYFPLTITHF